MVGKPEYEQDSDIKLPFKIKRPDGSYETGFVPETGEEVVLIRKLTPRQVRMEKYWGNEPELVEPTQFDTFAEKSQTTHDKEETLPRSK